MRLWDNILISTFTFTRVLFGLIGRERELIRVAFVIQRKSWFYFILLVLHNFSPILLLLNFYMILCDKYMLTPKIIWFFKSTRDFDNLDLKPYECMYKWVLIFSWKTRGRAITYTIWTNSFKRKTTNYSRQWWC